MTIHLKSMPMLEEIHKPSGPLTLSSTPIENATIEQPLASSNRACLLLSRSQHLWRQNQKSLTTNRANDTDQIQNPKIRLLRAIRGQIKTINEPSDYPFEINADAQIHKPSKAIDAFKHRLSRTQRSNKQQANESR